MSTEIPTVGRIVHFRESPGDACQAAIIVQPWSGETVNLVLFRDGSNDVQQQGLGAELTSWRTSIPNEVHAAYGYTGPTWHWPERVSVSATVPGAVGVG